MATLKEKKEYLNGCRTTGGSSVGRYCRTESQINAAYKSRKEQKWFGIILIVLVIIIGIAK